MTVGSGFGKEVAPAAFPATVEKQYGGGKNAKVAVDTGCLMHQCAYSVAPQLFQGDCEPLAIAMVRRAVQLQKLGVHAIYVFDGARSPDKESEDTKRSARRQAAIERLVVLQRGGDNMGEEELREEIESQARIAINIGWKAKREVMRGLLKASFDVLVAPYEADHQCAYLQITGQVAAVMSVDYDMLTHGVSALITKFNFANRGVSCLLYTHEKFAMWGSGKPLPHTTNFVLSLVGRLGPNKAFMLLSLVWKNDYSDFIPGIGRKKIEQILRYAAGEKVCMPVHT